MEKWQELLIFIILFLSGNIIIILICWFVSHALFRNRSSQVQFSEFNDERDGPDDGPDGGTDGDADDGGGGAVVGVGRVSATSPTILESLSGSESRHRRGPESGVEGISSGSQLSRGSSLSSSDSSSQSDDEEDMSTAMTGHSRTRTADTRLSYRLSCLFGTAASEPKSLLHNLRTQEENESMAFRQELRNIRCRGTAAGKSEEGGGPRLLPQAQADTAEWPTERVYSRYHVLVPVQRFDADYGRLERQMAPGASQSAEKQ